MSVDTVLDIFGVVIALSIALRAIHYLTTGRLVYSKAETDEAKQFYKSLFKKSSAKK